MPNRIENPFSAHIRKPRTVNSSLYEQYREAVRVGNVKLANAIANTLSIPLIPT